MKTKLENSEIIRLFNGGKTIKEISEFYGYNQETIRLRLKKEGIDTSKKKCSVLCCYCSGETRKEGFSNHHQRYLCLKCNKISIEGGIERKEKMLGKHKEIKKMYLEENLSTTEIGEKLGVSSTVPQRILKKYGLTRDINISKEIKTANKLNLTHDDYIKKLPIFYTYRKNVTRLTRQQKINSLDNSDKRGLCGVDGAYQLDHKYSILEGFKNNIDVKIISNINNLVFIPWEENLKKRDKSSITIEELLILINL